MAIRRCEQCKNALHPDTNQNVTICDVCLKENKYEEDVQKVRIVPPRNTISSRSFDIKVKIEDISFGAIFKFWLFGILVCILLWVLFAMVGLVGLAGIMSGTT